jgi:putative endonuclease
MSRALQGKVGYLAGLAAEDSVARDYDRRGLPIISRRWRGTGGEVDLIARDGTGVVFIEVKKSRTLALAAGRLGRRQMDRLCMAASEFVGSQPRGQLTEIRFDLAMVDGMGKIEIIENAFGAA